MGQPAKIARNHAAEPYVPRIQALLESADLRGARRLLAEARENGSAESELERLEKLLAPPTFKLTPAQDRDRSAEIHWLGEHADEYSGEWVALFGSELLGHSPQLQDLTRHLELVAPGVSALLHYVES